MCEFLSVKMNRIRLYLVLLLSLLFFKTNVVYGILPGSRLPVIGIQKEIIKSESDRVLKLAERQLSEKPFTVTSITCDRSSGGIHDYYSEGTYWWPDPENPSGPYIRKDGIRNPDNFDSHDEAIDRMSWIVGTQTSAYLLTGERKYVDAARIHLLAWFVDTTTRMTPNLLYAQAIHGICTGRGIGIIDVTSLIEVARSVSILEKSPYLSESDANEIKEWFASFLHWLKTHPYGVDEMNWTNNHATWWHAQAAAYADLLDDRETLQQCEKWYKEKLLKEQMAENGSFPEELARTKPFAYSLFNMDGVVTLVRILAGSYGNLWKFKLEDGRGMEKGSEFIVPFLENKETWPYQKDVSGWDHQPGSRSFLIYIAIAYDNIGYYKLYENLYKKDASKEAGGNSKIKNHILWMDLQDPLKKETFQSPISQ